MLYLNVSEALRSKWQRTIDLNYSLHLSTVHQELNSVEISIEEKTPSSGHKHLYQCRLRIEPKASKPLDVSVEWDDCGMAIEQCFAKAKRCVLRRMRGFQEYVPAEFKERETALGGESKLGY